MGKIKIHEIAKEVGVASKDVVKIANDLGFDVTSHLSSIDDEQAEKIKERISKKQNIGKKEESNQNSKNAKKDSTSSNSKKNETPVIIRREVIISEEEEKRAENENKNRENSKKDVGFVERRNKNDYNIVYRNKQTKPLTVSELFGLKPKEEPKKEEPKKEEPKKVIVEEKKDEEPKVVKQETKPEKIEEKVEIKEEPKEEVKETKPVEKEENKESKQVVTSKGNISTPKKEFRENNYQNRNSNNYNTNNRYNNERGNNRNQNFRNNNMRNDRNQNYRNNNQNNEKFNRNGQNGNNNFRNNQNNRFGNNNNRRPLDEKGIDKNIKNIMTTEIVEKESQRDYSSKAIDKQKARAIDMVDTAVGGMKTRFTNNGENPGIIILASSKRSEKSFLEEHMKKKALSEGDNTLIVDEAVWNIKPKGTYSNRFFYVAVGNRFLNSEVITEQQPDLDSYRNKGYRIIEVPIDLRPDFIDDIDRALCDFAGISSTQLSTYISGVRLSECKSDKYLNPFIKDIIEVGNAPTDKTQYWEFFDLSRVPNELKSKPLYIHLDMSVSGDKTGIAGTWIKGKKPSQSNEPISKDLYYQLAFNVSIKAPKGYQISFEKNRQFIRWLRDNGFRIKLVSCDTYQSYDLLQQLKSEKFNTEIVSVDKVNSDRVCVPYQHLKNVIYENRIIIYNKCDLLTEELTSLEKNNHTGRVDHPENGSKDSADAMCASVYTASQHAEEYSFEYGDDIDNITTVSTTTTDSDKQQITVDFENELKNAFSLLRQPEKEEKEENNSLGMDFGLGPAVPVPSQYISQGIMVW